MYVYIYRNIDILMLLCAYKQITDSLQEIFDENNLKLDQTSNIETGTNPLPFDELLEWVSIHIALTT